MRDVPDGCITSAIPRDQTFNPLHSFKKEEEQRINPAPYIRQIKLLKRIMLESELKPNSSLPIHHQGETAAKPNPAPPKRARAQRPIRDYVDADEMREMVSFIQVLLKDGHNVERSGKYIKCPCPFCEDKVPRFVIYEDMRANCYGCRWSGDVIRYVMKARDLDFMPALKWLNCRLDSLQRDSLDINELASTSSTSTRNGIKTPEAEIQKYSNRLATDEWIRARVCTLRHEYNKESWKAETIRSLAEEGSLGWSGDALTFIYPKGVKYRKWPENVFLWASEAPSIWRQHRLEAATHVYLAIKETAVINALDSGVEKDESVAVIAVSDAKSFQGEWGYLFKGKTVTLYMADDAAGRDAVDELVPLLKQYAAELRIPHFEEADEH